MVVREVDRKYLENPVKTPPILLEVVHLEVLNGHRASQVFSIVHGCEPTMVGNAPDAYGFSLEKVRCRYDPAGFADLGKKPQAPLPEFGIDA